MPGPKPEKIELSQEARRELEKLVARHMAQVLDVMQRYDVQPLTRT